MAEFQRMSRAARSLCLLLALAALGGCASTREQGEKTLQELLVLLPGSYDNLAQSRKPGASQAALRLMVAPVQAPLVGDHVYYVQEFAADDTRRVFAQRLYVVNAAVEGESPVLTQLDFNEPNRWRDGHLNRDLFRGLLIEDLRVRAGCDMVWTRTPGGFTAQGDAIRCRIAARSTGETLRAEQRMELDREGLGVLEIHRDAAGTVVYGGGADPWYRFSRRADAPW